MIYYHPVYAEEFEKFDSIKRVKVLYDAEKDYETNIYIFDPTEFVKC